MACVICKNLSLNSPKRLSELRKNLTILEKTSTDSGEYGFATCRSCGQQLRYDFSKAGKPKLTIQFIDDSGLLLRDKEFMNFQFTTVDWSTDQDEYAKALLSIAEKIAQVLDPGFTISLRSGCDAAGHINWKKSENCIGYFEYYTSVKTVFFRGKTNNRIEITAEFGFAYESDGTDAVRVFISGLPEPYRLFLKTDMGKTVTIYLTALSKQLDFIERTSLT